MSVEDINRFTKDDVVCALEMFNEDYVTFPRDDIAKLSGLTMPVNKRNFQKQADHLEIARAIRDIKAKQQGKKDWRKEMGGLKTAGRPRRRFMNGGSSTRRGARLTVTGKLALIRKPSGKWWDCPPPAVRFENGHVTVRVSPSQELSDWLLDALHDGGQE